ncbi:hypothetical protein EK21DRAFT_84807 [Setomelanomma holmii]|uniref:Ubiquitin 3 binding protein But2 C-terminal domain-containing protein n=1 Tax=Setomelanomma holmii TaxID=210430 RepID=A0A9P4HII1_9PLEO|nr:hypothetical protein EK21DRAFT_84807 [Setomelanomma holmii]
MLFTTLTAASLLSLAAAAPTNLEARWPPLTNILKPTVISLFDGSNGAITYNVGTGSATKTNRGDITTLVTFKPDFDIPETTCRLRFFLDNADNAVVLGGSKQVNIFSSLKPAPEKDVPAWGPPGNQRDQDLGRFSLYKGGNGDVVYAPAIFPCPKKGASIGFEVVPTGETDEVKCNPALSGLYLTRGS